MKTGSAAEAPRVRQANGRAIGGWLMFDWATQPFFTVINTFIFGPYFATKLVASAGGDAAWGQALWGYAAGTAGFIIAILSPILGAAADAGGARKPWIFGFIVLLVFGSMMLWWAAPGYEYAIAIALIGYAIGMIGAEFGAVFTNAMMPDLADESRMGRLSGNGWAVGYAGGLVCLMFFLGFLVSSPETRTTMIGLAPLFGLDPDSFQAERAAGPVSALWCIVFSLPLFLYTPDRPSRMPVVRAIGTGLRTIRQTLSQLRTYRDVTRFLIARMVYQDGLLALTVFGVIYAAGTFGWETTETGVFGILLIVVGIVGCLLGGWLDDQLGPKRVIFGSVVVLGIASLAIISIDETHIGFVFQMAPPAGEGFFNSGSEKAFLVVGCVIGLFALSGKITSFVGPLAVGALTAMTNSQRIGISIIVLFFVAGAILLAGVRERS